MGQAVLLIVLCDANCNDFSLASIMIKYRLAKYNDFSFSGHLKEKDDKGLNAVI